MKRTLLIEEPVAQAIANYLITKPYREVAGLVQALQMLEPVPSSERQEEQPKEDTSQQQSA